MSGGPTGDREVPRQAGGRPLRIAVALAQGLLLVTWPLVVYFGGERLGPRGVALLLLALALPALVRAITRGPKSGARNGLSRETRVCESSRPSTKAIRGRVSSSVRALLGSSGGVVVILLLSALLDHSALLLAYPALVNLVLLVQFGLSLRGECSFVERFARLVDPDLSLAEVRYCRTVTAVWCGFFALNGTAAALLAALAPRAWWALYTGVVSYGLIGALFAAEWLVRKLRFRRFGPGLPDRAVEPFLRPRIHG